MHMYDTSQLPQGLREVSSERRDTEGKTIALDYQYELSNGLVSDAIEYIKSKHGNNIALVPIGGQSAGGGVFNSEKEKGIGPIVGLIITPAVALEEYNNIAYTMSNKAPEAQLKSHEFHINTKNHIAYAGAGVVLDQIVATVKKAMGTNYSVLGTDLTSSGYASAGATFMTGGMGPTRTNFARSIKEIHYYDGTNILSVSNRTELDILAETYGWTGFIQSIAVPIIEVPQHEFGFALPINNTPEELSSLVAYFADKTMIPENDIKTTTTFIAGLEIITGDALDLLVNHSPNLEGLDLLLTNCKVANKDSVVFISGFANSNPFENFDDPLGIFVDNKTSGLCLEQATPFKSLRAMKDIREGAPEQARRQFSDAPFFYKDHTDINVAINPNNISESVKAVITCYENYKTKLEKLIESEEQLDGNVQVYGHINPQGLDPHYRITLVSDDQHIIAAAKNTAKELYAELVQCINAVCKKTGSTICGGEKGIISNIKILNALKANKDDIPEELSYRLEKQQKAITAANPMFNWRSKI